MIALDNGFDEVLVIVGSAADTARRLAYSFDYQILHEGTPDPRVLASLGVPEGWAAQEALVGDAAQERGNFRLLSFPGQQTDQMRPGGNPWDTGGIFDINIRAYREIATMHARMNRSGFVGFGQITRWQFGPLDVQEAVLTDADGLGIAIMERMAPPLTGYEHVENQASYVFNSSQIVPDFAAARAFYVDCLGWKPIQETEWTHEDGRNCMGLPRDVAASCPMKVGIYQARGLNEGSVEIIEMAVEGVDMSNGRPPQRGIASLRFPMRDPQAFLDRAAQGGCEIVPLSPMTIAPYGEVRLGAAVTPWGARLEVFETA